jgi:hypothetical protein
MRSNYKRLSCLVARIFHGFLNSKKLGCSTDLLGLPVLAPQWACPPESIVCREALRYMSGLIYNPLLIPCLFCMCPCFSCCTVLMQSDLAYVLAYMVYHYICAPARGIMLSPMHKGIKYTPKAVWGQDGHVNNCRHVPVQIGGWRHSPLTYTILQPYLDLDFSIVGPHTKFGYIDHIPPADLDRYRADSYLIINIPITVLVQFVPVAAARRIAKLHGIHIGARATVGMLQDELKNHGCVACESLRTVLSIQNSHDHVVASPLLPPQYGDHTSHMANNIFPPGPLSRAAQQKIIQSACESMDSHHIEESGCAVCGQLTPLISLSPLSSIKKHLHVLSTPGTSRCERKQATDKIKDCKTATDDL